MINYVNNSFDKVLKPCDAQKFMELTQSELTEKLILGHRAGEKNSKAKLPALTYMGVLDEEKYNAYLKTLQETHPNGSQARLLGADKPAVVATDAFASAPSMGRTETKPLSINVILTKRIKLSSAMTESPLLGRGRGEASLLCSTR